MQEIMRAIFYINLDDKMHFFVQEVDRTNRGYGVLWEFPGGKVEKNQTITEGLISEIKEETGVDLLNFYDLEEIEKAKKYSVQKQLVDLETGQLQNKFHNITVYLIEANPELRKILESESQKLDEDKLSGKIKWVSYEELISLNNLADKTIINKLTLEDLNQILY